MKRMVVALLAAWAMTGRADVVVYKVTGNVRVFGGSVDVRRPRPAYFVWNPDTGELQDIFGDPTTMTYSTGALSVNWFNIVGPNGRSGKGFRYYSTNGTNDAYSVCYGYNASLTIKSAFITAPARVISAPSIMTCKPQAVTFDAQGNGTVMDGSFTLTFDRADTLSANFAGDSVSDVISFLTTRLLGMGYLAP